MKIHILGAAGEVTGSAYLVQTERSRVLIDFGLFQGSRSAEKRNRVPTQIPVKQLDAVLLTHAHLDHTGRLPLLCKKGYRKPVYATDATIDIAELILYDSAHLQSHDVERLNRGRRRAGQKPIAPLYDTDDVNRLKPLFQAVPYGQSFEPADGIEARMVDAGHILGSASIELTVEEQGTKRVVVFSGDIGPRDAPWLRDPVPLKHADAVFMESTYGDRDHRPLPETMQQFQEIVQEAVKRRGKILVPVFAVGRAQLLLYCMAGLFRRDVVPPMPVHLDSPMAIEATRIYARHTEMFDEEALNLIKSGQLSEDMETVRFCATSSESRALNDAPGPCMILAGAGMCNGGRILHHLRHNLYRPETTVIIVGYQSDGSLGRMLVDGKKMVKIFGERVAVRADVHTLGGFSAHAGQSELIRWLDSLAESRPKVVLTHGEDRGRRPLGKIIEDRYQLSVAYPEWGKVIEV